MKSISKSFETYYKLKSRSILQNSGKTGISRSIPEADQIKLLNTNFYQNKVSVIVRDRWINTNRIVIDDKEKALITLRDLLSTPGVLKHIHVINEKNEDSISFKNLEKHFSEIIKTHFDEKTAEKILFFVYNNKAINLL
jgi:hypothetical protein